MHGQQNISIPLNQSECIFPRNKNAFWLVQRNRDTSTSR